MNQLSKKSEIPVVLSNGQVVPPALFDDVERRVKETIQAIPPNAFLTAKQLYGPNDWAKLSTREKHLAGMCLFELVKSGQIPLMLATSPCSNNKKYCLKTSSNMQRSHTCPYYR